MVISAVPKTQLTLSLSSSNLLISGHSAKAYSHSALDRLSRYRVRNKTYFQNFLSLLPIPEFEGGMVGDSNSIYSQLFHLAALARKPQQLLTKSLSCPSHSTHVANPNFGTRYQYPPFPPFPPFGGTRPLANLTLSVAQPG